MRIALLLLSTILLVGYLSRGGRDEASRENVQPQDAREDAYRANNIGVALLEQFKYPEGATEFRRALKLDPSLAMARVATIVGCPL